LTQADENSPIILFDGVCNLCEYSVQFIITRDPRGMFKFAPLQSEAGQSLLNRHGISTDDLSTFVLLENGRVFNRSTAALRVVKRLGWPWPVLFVFMAVPGPIRDAVYDFIARNRYQWFGKKEQCMVPTQEVRARFLP
jgi:predicted DCC family thiol-disulfide oxidoreductase YuxK